MTWPAHAARTAPASEPTTLAAAVVGCVCAKFKPGVYACLDCWLVTDGGTDAVPAG